MSTAPQPPRPPVPPTPPRTSSHLVAIALLVLTLIVLVSGMVVWVGVRFLSRTVQVHLEEGARGQKEVSIKTPVGSFEVAKDKDVDEARLGLPIYPGAKRLKDENSVSLNFELPDKHALRVVIAKFETTDSLDKVKEFYKKRLGGDVTKFTERTPEGKTVFEIKRDEQEKIVALQSKWSGTQIDLVHVAHGRDSTN